MSNAINGRLKDYYDSMYSSKKQLDFLLKLNNSIVNYKREYLLHSIQGDILFWHQFISSEEMEISVKLLVDVFSQIKVDSKLFKQYPLLFYAHTNDIFYACFSSFSNKFIALSIA